MIILMGITISRRVVKRQLVLKHELALEKVKSEKEEKLNQEKLRFFTNISHELRTPLTLILGPVNQLLQEDQDSRQLGTYQLIFNNTQRLLKLVNQILDFRKVQDGTLRVKVTEVNILPQIKDIFYSFNYIADEKGINFKLYNPNNDIYAWVDTDKFEKVLYNLLSNAFKFTRNQGKIEVFVDTVESEQKSIVLKVKDNGIGLSEKDQKRIFDRFYQAKSGLENNTGTGIGLSLVKHLVEVHKGKMELISVPGKGSEFTISLPIEKSAYNEEEIFEIKSEKMPLEQPVIIGAPKIPDVDLKEKILIIEDNSELRSFIKNYLSHTYEVYEAENGKEGLEMCIEIKPMICVVDVMMPIMDGIEFCNSLKNDVSISHIPVVMLTALAEDESKIKGYKAGADGYLGKPFKPEVLSATISSIIRNRKRLKEQFSSDTNTEISYVSHSPVDEEFMERVRSAIEENMDNAEFANKDLCDLLGMSNSKLYRKLKEITDLSPNEFICTIRLKKSTELLRSGKYNVSEIAIMVGFSDPLYFSRCFKKQFGVSPSKY